jgi:hypothetical protein
LTDVDGITGINQDFVYTLPEGFYTLGQTVVYGSKSLLDSVRDQIIDAFVFLGEPATVADVLVELQTDVNGNQTGSCDIVLQGAVSTFNITLYAEKFSTWDLLGFPTLRGVVTPYKGVKNVASS